MEKSEFEYKEIVKKYQNYLYEQLNYYNNQNATSYDEMQTIPHFSYFKSEKIRDVIEKLVCLFEGEVYSCSIVKHDRYKYKCGLWGMGIDYVTDEVMIVVKGSLPVKHFHEYRRDENGIDEIVETGDAFVVQRSELAFWGGCINFYEVDGYFIIPSVDYKRFNYVKDFIDFIIGYRLKYSIKEEDISSEKLFDLLSVYANANRKQIESNYHKKNIERVHQYKNFLIDEKKRISESIDKELSRVHVIKNL